MGRPNILMNGFSLRIWKGLISQAAELPGTSSKRQIKNEENIWIWRYRLIIAVPENLGALKTGLPFRTDQE